MKYRISTIPFLKILNSREGEIIPLCTRCKSQDCSHNIVNKKVSIYGIVDEYRLYNRGGNFYIVVGCDGFVDGASVEDEELDSIEDGD